MQQKHEKKLDRRQIRTKGRIRDAFTALIMEKNIEKITIKELAQRADIDRKTFYLHYKSIFDVLTEIQDEFLGSVGQMVEECELLTSSFDALPLFRKINDLLNQNPAFYHRLAVSDQYGFFHDKLKACMKAFFNEKYSEHLAASSVSPVKLNLYSEYVASGLTALYVEWLKHPEFDLEEVAEAASEIFYGGGRAVIDSILNPSNR